MSGRAGRWRNLENDPSSWPGLARPHAPHSTAGGWLRSVHAEHALLLVLRFLSRFLFREMLHLYRHRLVLCPLLWLLHPQPFLWRVLTSSSQGIGAAR